MINFKTNSIKVIDNFGWETVFFLNVSIVMAFCIMLMYNVNVILNNLFGKE